MHAAGMTHERRNNLLPFAMFEMCAKRRDLG